MTDTRETSRSAALLQSAFQVTGDAVVFLDQTGFFDCNPAALRMFGYDDKSDFLSKHPVQLSPPNQPDGRSSLVAAEDYMRQAYEQGHVAFAFEHQRSDGTPFPAEIMLASVSVDGVPALSATVRDVSSRRAVEDELRRQREALHQSEKLTALGSLLAGVAHELNNPLAVVVTQAVLLRETSTDARTIARAEKIETAAERCGRIVKSFLAIARQRPPARTPVAMDEVVESALNLTIYGLRSSGIALSVDIPAELPAVMGDADQLGQLVMNLVVNAQQALQRVEGKRSLAIAGSRRGDRVRVTFADNGPGVPDTLRSRIYDPFFTTKPPGDGTGIGLSICQSIAASHGGTLSCEDTPGGGATFALTLPAARDDLEEADESEETASGDATGSILIVDDEPEIVDSLREILRPLARHVDVASTGNEALTRIASCDYDLMLSDLRMPELDGPGLYSALLGRGSGAPAKIIFITGDALDGAVREFVAQTGLPVLEKPFTPAEVRSVVAAALAELRAADPLRTAGRPE